MLRPNPDSNMYSVFHDTEYNCDMAVSSLNRCFCCCNRRFVAAAFSFAIQFGSQNLQEYLQVEVNHPANRREQLTLTTLTMESMFLLVR